MLVSAFYLIPHLGHCCLAKRALSCSSAMEMAPEHCKRLGRYDVLSSTHSSLPMTLIPQRDCTGGIKDKTFHAPVCADPPVQQLRIPVLFLWCKNSAEERNRRIRLRLLLSLKAASDSASSMTY